MFAALGVPVSLFSYCVYFACLYNGAWAADYLSDTVPLETEWPIDFWGGAKMAAPLQVHTTWEPVFLWVCERDETDDVSKLRKQKAYVCFHAAATNPAACSRTWWEWFPAITSPIQLRLRTWCNESSQAGERSSLQVCKCASSYKSAGSLVIALCRGWLDRWGEDMVSLCVQTLRQNLREHGIYVKI